MTTSAPLTVPGGTADCCSSLTGGVLAAEDAQRLARMFKALGDPVRVRLLSLIAAKPDDEACICDLTEPVGLSQPTVSHHMKKLVEAGFVTREQRGRWAHYRLAPEALTLLSGALDPQAPTTGLPPTDGPASC